LSHVVAQGFRDFEEARRRDAADFFRPGSGPVHLARAPGRLDVMGGIADYSGSLVAEMPIAQAAFASVQAGGTEDGSVVVRSANALESGLTPEVTLPAEIFINPVSLLRRIREHPASERWIGYVAGGFSLLRAESLIPRGVGGRIFISSEVPLGAGVSSSAAVEVATMRALCSAFGISLEPLALARLCQRVENDVMDAPCGIMDQVTSSMGQAGTLLTMLCQPHEVRDNLDLPAGWTVFGIDSRVKHSVAGAGYTNVRVAAFMGYKILTSRAANGFGGYLCNVTPDEYLSLLPERLPVTEHGGAFLAHHGGIYDTVTAVDANENYPVRAAAEHAIYEMDRVQRFVAALREGSDDAVRGAGQLMYDSHASYSACGLGSEATDLLVALARAHPSVAGAKITGGGSGGTVGVLCRADVEAELAQALASSYRDRTGVTPRLIHGTSPGALSTPVQILHP
jgi:galactokinase